MAKKKKDVDLLDEEINPDLADLDAYLDSDESKVDTSTDIDSNSPQDFVLPADGSVQLAYDLDNNPVYVEYDYDSNQYVDHFSRNVIDISNLHNYDGYPFYFFAEDAPTADEGNYNAYQGDAVGDVKQALTDIDSGDVDSMIATELITTGSKGTEGDNTGELASTTERLQPDELAQSKTKFSDVSPESKVGQEKQAVQGVDFNPIDNNTTASANVSPFSNSGFDSNEVNQASLNEGSNYVEQGLTRELNDENPTLDLGYDVVENNESQQFFEQKQNKYANDFETSPKKIVEENRSSHSVDAVSGGGKTDDKFEGLTREFHDETKKIQEVQVDSSVKNKAYQRIKKFRESLIKQTDNDSLKKVFESIARNEHPTLDKFSLFKMDNIQSCFTSVLVELIKKINFKKKEVVETYEKTIQSIKSVVNSILKQNEEYKKSLNKNVRFVIEKQDAIVSALSTGFKDKSVREMSSGIDYDGLKIAHLNCWTIYENMLNNMNRIRNLEILNISIQKYYNSILIIIDNDKKLAEQVNRKITHNYIEMSRIIAKKTKDSALSKCDDSYNLNRFKEYARNFMFDVNSKLNKIDITNVRPVDIENKYDFLNELDLPNIPNPRNNLCNSLDSGKNLGDVVWNSFKQSRSSDSLDLNDSVSFSGAGGNYTLKNRKVSLSPLTRNRLNRIAVSRRKYLRDRLS